MVDLWKVALSIVVFSVILVSFTAGSYFPAKPNSANIAVNISCGGAGSPCECPSGNNCVQILVTTTQAADSQKTYFELKIIRKMKFEEVMSQLIEKFPRAQFQGVQNNKFSLVGKSDILEHTQRFLLDNSYSGEESDEELRLIYSGFLQPGWDTVPVGWAKIGGANGDFYVFAIGATGTRNEPTILKISSDGTITEVSQDVGVRYVFVS